MADTGQDGLPLMPEIADVSLRVPVEALGLPRFERPLQVGVREALGEARKMGVTTRA